jgi:DNA-binding NtrC family response regulator
MREAFVGESPAIQHLRDNFSTLTRCVEPVVIVGEPGTGKTLLASHLSPPGTEIRFINCMILAEREQRLGLLGGGFPELSSTKRSILERPGIALVKHLDFAPHYLQDELVEALRSGIIPRDTKVKPPLVKSRTIFTFRRHWRELAAAKRLTHRCSEFLKHYETLSLPPLRERLHDLPLLANHFARQVELKQFTSRDLNVLREYPWPDNVRELKAFVRGLVIHPLHQELSFREKLELARIVAMIDDGEECSLDQFLDRVRYLLVDRASQRWSGCRATAARMLGISERSVTRLVGGKRDPR